MSTGKQVLTKPQKKVGVPQKKGWTYKTYVYALISTPSRAAAATPPLPCLRLWWPKYRVI
jgi:hypothetical protein